MVDEKKATADAVDARVVEIMENTNKLEDRDSTYTTSVGVVLKIVPVPPLFFVDLERKFAPPEPPIVGKEGDEDYQIPNPNHPSYVAELERLEADKSAAMIDAMIGVGTIVQHVPESLPRVDDEDWIEMWEFYIGATIPRTGPGRELAWKKYVALRGADDIHEVSRLVSLHAGVTEVEVNEALAGFRDVQER